MAMIPPGEELKMLEPIECTGRRGGRRLAELPPKRRSLWKFSTSGIL